MALIKRLLHHFVASSWSASHCVPPRPLKAIKGAITASEAGIADFPAAGSFSFVTKKNLRKC